MEEALLLRYNLQFFAESDGGEKTEEATDKKLRDAREEGKVAKSMELTSSFQLIALFLILKFFIGFVGEGFIGVFNAVFSLIPDWVTNMSTEASVAGGHAMIQFSLLRVLLICLPFFGIGFLVAFVSSVVQVGWEFSSKPLKPSLDAFNPVNGFKRIFSKRQLFELVKSIVKIALIFYVAYLCIRDHANELFILYDMSLKQAIALIGDVVIDTGLRISLVYLVVGVGDYIYQRRKFKNDMKMTKQEVKDEYKSTEGDPQIKGRQRQIMREASQRRMMQDVPKADVVITNPTHIAVAIRYVSGEDAAPVVLAKGEDFLAQKIKEVAKDNDVRIMENKPLARALYATCEIGEVIPPELYQAVAEVLAMVYQNQY